MSSEAEPAVPKARAARLRQRLAHIGDLKVSELAQTARDRWHVLLLGAATLAGVISGAVPPPWNWIPIGFAAVAFLIGSIRAAIVHEPYVRLLRLKASHETEALGRQANFRIILDALLSQLSNEVGIANAETRVSGYSHNGKAFILVGRVSENPKLRIRGRQIYPEDQGLIADAWQGGQAQCVSLPGELEAYVVRMERDYNLPPDVTRALTMRPRSLIGIRVVDKMSNRPVGVVVAESMTPRGVNKKTMEKIRASETWMTIVYLMVTSRELLPDMASVSEKGF
jgi:hypothetical protein